MLFYFLQTSLMLLVSYFLGCWLGCTLRNTIGSREPVPVRAADARTVAPVPASLAPAPAPVRPPSIAPTPRAASATEPAFRRTDVQSATPPPAPPQAATPPAPPVAAAPPAPPPRPVDVRPAPAPAAVVAAPAPAPVVPQPAAPAGIAPAAIVRPAAVTGVSVTAAAAAAAAAAVAQGRARETTIGKPPADAILTPAATGERVSLPAAGASSGVSGVAVGGQARVTATTGSDDLKRIRGVGPEIEAALHRIGVRRFGEVAGWSSGDVDNISKTLGLKGRIEHENWIEQAQVLSKGGETAFSRRYDRGEIEIMPVPKGPIAPVATAAEGYAGRSSDGGASSERFRSHIEPSRRHRCRRSRGCGRGATGRTGGCGTCRSLTRSRSRVERNSRRYDQTGARSRSRGRSDGPNQCGSGANGDRTRTGRGRRPHPHSWH